MRITLVLSAATLAASLLLGGGTGRGLLSDLLPELLALTLLVWVGPRAWPLLRRDRLLSVLVLGAIAVPIMQLIPLPPALWGALPGRGPILAAFTTAGVSAPWAPLSLAPGATWRAGFSLLPGLALCLANLALDAAARRRLIFLALAIGVVSVPLGMLQVLSGSNSPLDFYAGGEPSSGRASGFFANPNHTATYLAMLIPLAAAVTTRRSERHHSVPSLAIAGSLIVVFLLGLALTGSRSVLILGLLALAATAVVLLRPQLAALRRRRGAWLAALIGGLALAPLALGMGLLQILQRFGAADVADDLRWTIARVTWGAVWPYFPAGAGGGAFEAVYQRHEPASALIFQLVNHAHNDWLELLLETGALGGVLLLLWVVWLARRSRHVLGAGTGEPLARAAVIGLWLVSLHSAWDYPLRTVALSALTGLLVGAATPLETPQLRDRSKLLKST